MGYGKIMKKLIRMAALLLTLLALCACSNEDDTADGEDDLQNAVKMTATVTAVADKVEVEVIEGEYGASGPYWVVISEETRFADKKGKAIKKEDLKEGDKVEIYYGGQVMMSYPPQIVAIKIAVVE